MYFSQLFWQIYFTLENCFPVILQFYVQFCVVSKYSLVALYKTYQLTSASLSYPRDQDPFLKIFDVAGSINWKHQSRLHQQPGNSKNNLWLDSTLTQIKCMLTQPGMACILLWLCYFLKNLSIVSKDMISLLLAFTVPECSSGSHMLTISIYL